LLASSSATKELPWLVTVAVSAIVPLFGITSYLLAALRFTVTRMMRLVLLW
jgi:hypothetical protein